MLTLIVSLGNIGDLRPLWKYCSGAEIRLSDISSGASGTCPRIHAGRAPGRSLAAKGTDGNAAWGSSAKPAGLPLGRVRLAVQPSKFGVPRAAALSAAAAGSRDWACDVWDGCRDSIEFRRRTSQCSVCVGSANLHTRNAPYFHAGRISGTDADENLEFNCCHADQAFAKVFRRGCRVAPFRLPRKRCCPRR